MKRRWYLIGTAGLFGADQILKAWTEQKLDKEEERRTAGPVVLRRVNNRGICLGLLSGQPEAVRILSLAASGAVSLSYAAALISGRRIRKTGLCMAAAGAWSNTADRFVRGYVVDYVGFDIKNHPKLAALTYNLGDFLIAAGGVLVSLDQVRSQFALHRYSRQK